LIYYFLRSVRCALHVARQPVIKRPLAQFSEKA